MFKTAEIKSLNAAIQISKSLKRWRTSSREEGSSFWSDPSIPELLCGLGGGSFFNGYFFDNDWRGWIIARSGWSVCNFINHIHSRNHSTKNCVLIIEFRTVRCTIKNWHDAYQHYLRVLPSITIPRLVRNTIELLFQSVPAFPAPSFDRIIIFRIRITSLNHKSFNDTMKLHAIVKSFFGKCLEVLYVFRRGV